MCPVPRGLCILWPFGRLYQEVFVFSTSLLVFQRYLTILHRLGMFEKRDAVFAALTHDDHRFTPWLTVWQCPDRVRAATNRYDRPQ